MSSNIVNDVAMNAASGQDLSNDGNYDDHAAPGGLSADSESNDAAAHAEDHTEIQRNSQSDQGVGNGHVAEDHGVHTGPAELPADSESIGAGALAGDRTEFQKNNQAGPKPRDGPAVQDRDVENPQRIIEESANKSPNLGHLNNEAANDEQAYNTQSSVEAAEIKYPNPHYPNSAAVKNVQVRDTQSSGDTDMNQGDSDLKQTEESDRRVSEGSHPLSRSKPVTADGMDVDQKQGEAGPGDEPHSVPTLPQSHDARRQAELQGPLHGDHSTERKKRALADSSADVSSENSESQKKKGGVIQNMWSAFVGRSAKHPPEASLRVFVALGLREATNFQLRINDQDFGFEQCGITKWPFSGHQLPLLEANIEFRNLSNSPEQVMVVFKKEKNRVEFVYHGSISIFPGNRNEVHFISREYINNPALGYGSMFAWLLQYEGILQAEKWEDGFERLLNLQNGLTRSYTIMYRQAPDFAISIPLQEMKALLSAQNDKKKIPLWFKFWGIISLENNYPLDYDQHFLDLLHILDQWPTCILRFPDGQLSWTTSFILWNAAAIIEQSPHLQRDSRITHLFRRAVVNTIIQKQPIDENVKGRILGLIKVFCNEDVDKIMRSININDLPEPELRFAIKVLISSKYGLTTVVPRAMKVNDHLAEDKRGLCISLCIDELLCNIEAKRRGCYPWTELENPLSDLFSTWKHSTRRETYPQIVHTMQDKIESLLWKNGGWPPKQSFPPVPPDTWRYGYSQGLCFLSSTLTRCLTGMERLSDDQFWNWLELAAFSSSPYQVYEQEEPAEWSNIVCNDAIKRVDRMGPLKMRLDFGRKALFYTRHSKKLQGEMYKALKSLRISERQASDDCVNLLEFLSFGSDENTRAFHSFAEWQLIQRLEQMTSLENWSIKAQELLDNTRAVQDRVLMKQSQELIIRYAVYCGVNSGNSARDCDTRPLKCGSSPGYFPNWRIIDDSDNNCNFKLCQELEACIPRPCLIECAALWTEILDIFEQLNGKGTSSGPALAPIKESGADMIEHLMEGNIEIRELSSPNAKSDFETPMVRDLLVKSSRYKKHEIEKKITEYRQEVKLLEKCESSLCHQLPTLLGHFGYNCDDAGRRLYRHFLSGCNITGLAEDEIRVAELAVNFSSINTRGGLQSFCPGSDSPAFGPAGLTTMSKFIEEVDKFSVLYDTHLNIIWKDVLGSQLSSRSEISFSNAQDADEEGVMEMEPAGSSTDAQNGSDEGSASGSQVPGSSSGRPEGNEVPPPSVESVEDCIVLWSRVTAGYVEELRKLEKLCNDGPVTRDVVQHLRYWRDANKETISECVREIESKLGIRARHTNLAENITYFLHGRSVALIKQYSEKLVSALLETQGQQEDGLFNTSQAQQLDDFLRLTSSIEDDRTDEGGEEGDAATTIEPQVFQTIRFIIEQLERDYGPLNWSSVAKIFQVAASDSGKEFLKLLQEFTEKNEDLVAKLTELIDDAHTINYLDDACVAIDFLQPIVYIACTVNNNGTEPETYLKSHHRMQYAQEDELEVIRQQARGSSESKDVARIALRVVALLAWGPNDGIVDCVIKVLRQGGQIKEKIEEDEDDAMAVHHIIDGILSRGEFMLERSSENSSEYTIIAKYSSHDEQSRDVDEFRLMECSDKAALTVPHAAASEEDRTDAQNRVSLFTELVKLITSLKTQLSLLHQVGHPHLLYLLSRQEKEAIRVPLAVDSYGFRNQETMMENQETMGDIREFHGWTIGANDRWRECIRKNRDSSLALSCTPASKIVPLIEFITAREFEKAFSLMSSPPTFDAEGFYQNSADLLEEACASVSRNRDPDDSEYDRMMSRLRDVFDDMRVTVHVKRKDALESVLQVYRKDRNRNDVTTKSIMEIRNGKRAEPSFHFGKALLIREEDSHDRLTKSEEVQSTITLFSVLFPLNLAPHPDLTLHCDIHTSKDDILRFFHIMRHCAKTSHESSSTAVVVHADKLSLDVRQALCNELLREQQVAKQAHKWSKKKVMRVAIILTKLAPPEIVGTFEELSITRRIPILQRHTVERVLRKATEISTAYQNTFVVSSNMPGKGKTYWVKTHPKWASSAKTTSLVWGGAQTRSQAAVALARGLEGSPDCIHLEVFPFENLDVDADLVMMELLLWRRVYDPQGSTWCRVPENTALFVEVANTLMVKECSILQRDAPLIWDVPNHEDRKGDEPFDFTEMDRNAKDFAIAGTALLMEEFNVDPNNVTCSAYDGAANNNAGYVFKLHPETEEAGVTAVRMNEILTTRKSEVAKKAEVVLQQVAREDTGEEGRSQPCEPTKAMIMNFFHLLSFWVAKWAHQYSLYKLQTEDWSRDNVKVEMCPKMLDVLKEMIEMAAAVSLRSSAGQAQAQAFKSRQASSAGTTVGDDAKDDGGQDYLNALAYRVRDIHTKRESAWTFNHGGALAIIGDKKHVPKELINLWDNHNKATRGNDKVNLPPESLLNASQLELQQLLLQSVSAPERDHTSVKKLLNDYVLHRDIMIKMVDISERLKCSLPVLLMGEAGCGKTILVRLTATFMGIEMIEESVHAGTTDKDIVRAIDKAEAKVHELEKQKKIRDSPFVLLFFDELNTCSHLPVFKRLLIDRLHPLRQDPVHPRLRFVGACNPWRKADEKEVCRDKSCVHTESVWCGCK